MKLFGTDGIRGRFGHWPITAETMVGLGEALGATFARNLGARRPMALIARDTRASSPILLAAIAAGLAKSGVLAEAIGVAPTPAVPILVAARGADLGIMVTASHNRAPDNGVKIFTRTGDKLSDDLERAIEAALADAPLDALIAPPMMTPETGDALSLYLDRVAASLPAHFTLVGRKIVLDAAHGAAFATAPALLRRFGAEVIAIGCAPDGANINADCGSTAPAAMQQLVREIGADLGIALDGDGDRLTMADETGALIDGDQALGALALAAAQAGALRGGCVVGTLMTNIGLERALAQRGIGLERAKVGDRYVIERMRARGANYGGEQSGHLILGDIAATGDGVLAALHALALMAARGEPASTALRAFDPAPQILRNLPLPATGDPMAAPAILAAIAEAQALLAPEGRLVIRKSGTEPLIRVMTEGEDVALQERVQKLLAEAIAAA